MHSTSARTVPDMTESRLPKRVELPGHVEWLLDGVWHRIDGPAVEYNDGVTKYWYEHGVPHREDGPAAVKADGSQYWYYKGVSHRADGPAVIKADGSQYWYYNGVTHREGGPAATGADGSQYWYHNGRLHRVDGPAVTGTGGHDEWWIEGRQLTLEEAEAYAKLDGNQQAFVAAHIADSGHGGIWADLLDVITSAPDACPTPRRARQRPSRPGPVSRSTL